MARKPRSAESREATARKGTLREMPVPSHTGRFHVPRERWPHGKVLRWVALSVLNQDVQNWEKRVDGGWEAVQRSMYPDLFPYIARPGQENSPYADIIVRGGQVLMQCPEHLFEKHRLNIRRANEEAMRSVAFIGDQDPTMPRHTIVNETAIERVTTERSAAFKE